MTVARWAAGRSGTVVVPDVRKWSYTDDTVGPTQTLEAAGVPVEVQGSVTAVPMAIEGTLPGALVVMTAVGFFPGSAGWRCSRPWPRRSSWQSTGSTTLTRGNGSAASWKRFTGSHEG